MRGESCSPAFIPRLYRIFTAIYSAVIAPLSCLQGTSLCPALTVYTDVPPALAVYTGVPRVWPDLIKMSVPYSFPLILTHNPPALAALPNMVFLNPEFRIPRRLRFELAVPIVGSGYL
jgi:hypothetical protein